MKLRQSDDRLCSVTMAWYRKRGSPPPSPLPVGLRSRSDLPPLAPKKPQAEIQIWIPGRRGLSSAWGELCNIDHWTKY